MNEILQLLLESLKQVPNDVRKIVDRRIQLIILEIGRSTSVAVAGAVPKIIGGLLAAIGMMFLLIGLSVWLGQILGNSAYGFLVVGGSFTIIGVLFLALRRDVNKSPIKRQIDKKFIDIANQISEIKDIDTVKQLEQKNVEVKK